MSLLTLDLKDDADLNLFISFAKRLNVAILEINPDTQKYKTLTKSKRYFGCGKHLVKKISDDFNVPLNDFKEYMP